EVAQGYNTFIRLFPRNIWASLFGFDKKPYFEAAEGSDQAPVVEF
ncbi:MAG: LemA family protein, partial [Bacteroidales bacterium]